MPYTPVTIDRFGGWNLHDDPQDVGLSGATDLSDVDLFMPERVATRNGFTNFLASTATQQPQDLGQHAGSYSKLHLIAYLSDTETGDAVVAAFDSSGASVATTAHAKAGLRFTHTSIASLGVGGTTPTTFVVPWCYFPNPSGTARFANGPLFQWDGATWTAPGTTVAAIAAWPAQSRLAAAADLNDGIQRVKFSDAGAPTTFGVNNFVSLNPGDGESIIALVGWREFLVAFKQSQVFAFYSVSTLTDGSPVFNYRADRGRVGVAVPNCAVAAPDGIYHFDATGVYRWAGGGSVKVSGNLDPLFNGTATTPINQSVYTARMAYNDGRVYLSVPTGASTANDTLLVYDIAGGYWLKWSLGCRGLASLLVSGRATLVSSYPSTKQVRAHGLTATDDAGSAISWSYTSGYFTPADGQRVVQRGSSVWGTGTVTLQMLTQGARTNDVADAGGSVVLGTSPTVAEGKRRRACRGVTFAHKLSGSGVASVSRVTHRFMMPEGDV